MRWETGWDMRDGTSLSYVYDDELRKYINY
jgi:hypothetical protein